MKKKALLSSVLTILLCLSLIAGSTFALFTDEAKTNVAVTSGKVDVVATVENIQLYSPKTIGENGTILDNTNIANGNVFANGGTVSVNENTVTLDKIVPGDYVTFDIVVENKSNVSIQYRTIIKKLEDTGLWSGLKVTIDESLYNGETKKSEWAELAVGAPNMVISVKIELPAEAGNEYQDKTCTFAYVVEAAQANAQMPSEWNDGDEASAPNQVDGVYHITSAAEFIQYINELNNERQNGSHRYDMASVVLDKDIDLNGYVFEVRGEGYAYTGNFDGQGHTVSNYTVKRTDAAYYTGLFSVYMQGGSIKNLTVKNGTVIGQKQAAAIVPSVCDGSTVEGCHAIDCTVVGVKKVGAVSGYNEYSTVKNCTATNCDVYASEPAEAFDFGYANTGSIFVGNVATNVNLYTNTSGVTSAAELKAALLAGGHVVIVNDIDMTGVQWNPEVYPNAGYPGLVLDGNNKTISGLTNPLINFEANGRVQISDLTIVNAVIDATYDEDMGVGAFVGCMDTGANLTLNNCHVKNSRIEAYGDCRAAALVGYIGSGNASITNCSVENTVIKTDNGAAVIIAYAGGNTTISGCEVKGTTSVSSTENREGDAAKAGYLVGTVQNTTTITNCTVASTVTLSNVNAKAPVANGMVGRCYGAVEMDGTVWCAAAHLKQVLSPLSVYDNNNLDVVVSLNKNYVVLDDWTSMTYPVSPYITRISSLTINGNGHTISGLTKALLAPVCAKNITIENLTIKDSDISAGTGANEHHAAAFVPYIDNNIRNLVLNNCHAVNVNVTANDGSASSAGALVGYAYTHSTDGLCAKVEIKNCSVTGGSVTNTYGNAAGIIGFCATGTTEDSHVIENSSVTNCTITGEENAKTGAIVGTVNNNGTLYITGCTWDTTYKVIGRNTYNGSSMATVIVDSTSVTI